MRCSDCKSALQTLKYRERLLWRCKTCGGWAVPLDFLQRFQEASEVLQYLNQVPKNPVLSKRHCPVCSGSLQIAMSGGGVTELDICRKCKVVWFDASELKLGSTPEFGSKTAPHELVRQPVVVDRARATKSNTLVEGLEIDTEAVVAGAVGTLIGIYALVSKKD